jgi:hypothetical protein
MFTGQVYFCDHVRQTLMSWSLYGAQRGYADLKRQSGIEFELR